jgi:hypothetical protein
MTKPPIAIMIIRVGRRYSIMTRFLIFCIFNGCYETQVKRNKYYINQSYVNHRVLFILGEYSKFIQGWHIRTLVVNFVYF